MNSALHDMELADNMQTLYKILLETHPDNEQIQKELGKLTNNKDTYLRQIIDLWDKRTQARYTEIEIKQICSTYYANETENAVVDSLQGREKCKKYKLGVGEVELSLRKPRRIFLWKMESLFMV